MAKKKSEGKITEALRKSPINYFSDLFICAIVVIWILDNVYQSIIATAVTVSSIALSNEMGYACYDTSMWSSIGENVAVPLTAGGALWLVKCGVQHAIANKDGEQAHMDFPKVDVGEIEIEKEIITKTDDQEGEKG